MLPPGMSNFLLVLGITLSSPKLEQVRIIPCQAKPMTNASALEQARRHRSRQHRILSVPTIDREVHDRICTEHPPDDSGIVGVNELRVAESVVFQDSLSRCGGPQIACDNSARGTAR